MKKLFVYNGLIIAFAVGLFAPGIASICWAGDAESSRVVIDLSEDLVAFAKFVGWAGLGFLGVLALLGVMFFGFDVRKAHAEIARATEKTKKLGERVKADHDELLKIKQEMLGIKERFDKTVAEAEQRMEELGALMETLTDQEPAEDIRPVDSHQEGDSVQMEPAMAEKDGQSKRSIEELMASIILSGNFDWTTMRRLIKKTGLSREEILETARGMPDIEIGFGKKTQDHIFRLTPMKK